MDLKTWAMRGGVAVGIVGILVVAKLVLKTGTEYDLALLVSGKLVGLLFPQMLKGGAS